MTKVEISLEDVTLKKEGQRIFDGLNCLLSKDLITVLLGYNGAGKTAFLRIISGLSMPDNGSVRLTDGSDILPYSRCTMLLHKPVMLKRNVWRNIVYAQKRGKLDNTDLEQFIQDAKITHLLERPAREISAGEQQRVAFARALVTAPKVLLLDEPTSNLDPFSVRVIEKLIQKASFQGIKIVLVSHDIEQAKRIAGEIIYLQNGKILAQKTKDQFFNCGENREWCNFLSGKENTGV